MKTRLSVSQYEPTKWLQLDTDYDLREEHVAAARCTTGVVRAYRLDRYQLKIEIGNCFDAMTVGTAVREAVEAIS